MSEQAALQNVVNAVITNWRKVTLLHRTMGARAIRLASIALSAGIETPLLQTPYGPATIDRVIGLFLNVETKAKAGVITIQDLSSNWRMDISATSQFGAYWLNVETLTDAANLVITSSVAIVIDCSLHNFEMPPASIGHI